MAIKSKLGILRRHLECAVDEWTWKEPPCKSKASAFEVPFLTIPGQTGKGNFRAMQYAMEDLPRNFKALEIGSFCGLSAVLLCQLSLSLKKNGVLYSCDPWNLLEDTSKSSDLEKSKILDSYAGEIGNANRTLLEHIQFLFELNCKNHLGSFLPYSFKMFSADFFEKWNNGEEKMDIFSQTTKLGGLFHFVYIDGDHSEAGSYTDLKNSDKHLAEGGYILADDSGWRQRAGSHRAVKRFLKEYPYEVVSRNPNYLIRKCSSK